MELELICGRRGDLVLKRSRHWHGSVPGRVKEKGETREREMLGIKL